jgi:hypothetical protein
MQTTHVSIRTTVSSQCPRNVDEADDFVATIDDPILSSTINFWPKCPSEFACLIIVISATHGSSYQNII